MEHLETPYVVKLHRVTPLAGVERVFSFAHPREGAGGGGDARANARSASVTFARPASLAGLVHGFAGYFDTTLHGGVRLSTHPDTHTPGMASWFPIFFPLAAPLPAPAGAPITVHVWRCVSAHKVWYEWAAECAGVHTHVHNPNGRSYHVGL